MPLMCTFVICVYVFFKNNNQLILITEGLFLWNVMTIGKDIRFSSIISIYVYHIIKT